MSGSLLAEAMDRHRAGDLAGAEAMYRRVLQSQPKHVLALHFLSTLMVQKGNLAEGLRLARRCTALHPDAAEYWRHQAGVLVRLGQNAEALASLDRAVALRPEEPDPWTNRGTVLAALGRYAEALASFDHALALAPESAQALANRGLALLELRQPDAALETFDRILAAQPRDPLAHNNRGLALQALDRHTDAVASFDQALALSPAFPDALNHRGVSLQALGQASAALASYEQAMAQQPDDPWFHWNAGLCRLLMGDYARGWSDYEWRLRAIATPRFDKPLWQGEPLKGRTLLLHTEQGLGDIIQFCRYAPLIRGAGRVILQVPAVLVALLRSLPPPVEVVPAGIRPPRFDLHCPLLSVPARFGSTVETLPRTVPYLTVPPGPVPQFGVGRTIGICWQGNPAVRIDPERSVPLARFAPLAAVPGVRLVSLQKGHGLDQLPALPGIETFGPDGPASFVATAATMLALDLVVTSDTVVAHLAGALGCPVWLATSFVPDWRWGLTGETCPWYPTMRLFRQPRRGDWEAVFAAMAAALRADAALP
ncbi:MAG: tetratricopeptide repeat protein [Acetobacteraceae bacterium]|nr:tetratricopeptide repeat protein [Acetobacteraceae bacterium]